MNTSKHSTRIVGTAIAAELLVGAATGDHCPVGRSFHRMSGPGFVNLPQMSVESSYYTWVDQHDTLGLGANVRLPREICSTMCTRWSTESS